MTAADYDAEHERTVRELRADGKPAAENPFRSACAWAAERLEALLCDWDKLVRTDQARGVVRSVMHALDEESNPRLKGKS